MEQTFSRRGFLKGAAAAALAVSAMGLTGCAGEDGPTTAVVLGDYKVDVDVRKSTRRSDTRNTRPRASCFRWCTLRTRPAV